VIQKLGVTDVSALSRDQVEAMVEDGALVFFQGPVYFRRERSQRSDGVGQLRKAYTKGVGVELDLSFDAWECTSTSSWSNRLSGRKVASIVGIASGKEVRGSRVFIQLSCLGIGTFFERIHWGTWHHKLNVLAEEEGDVPEEDLPRELSLSDLSRFLFERTTRRTKITRRALIPRPAYE
jgi:hypothetical protein